MSYIWEKYLSENRYKVAKKICPYIEVFNNQGEDIEVNPLLRFSTLFELIGSKDILEYIYEDDKTESENEENKAKLENVVFHFLAQLDKNKGLYFRQTLIEKIRNEISDGLYGEFVQKSWGTLSSKEQETILYGLSQRRLLDNENFFMDTINKIFPASSLFYERNTNLYYLYIYEENTEDNIKKYELIKYLFWNKNYTLQVVWKYYYGIIGVSDTMKIDQIQII
jgi:hypothetical protein